MDGEAFLSALSNAAPAPEFHAGDAGALVPARGAAAAAASQPSLDLSGFSFAVDPAVAGTGAGPHPQPGGFDAVYYQPFPQPGAWDFNYN